MTPGKRGNRGLGFDRDVRAFSYLFRFFQHQGVFAVRDMVDLLNVNAPLGPYGRGWNHAVVYRMLNRGAELGECLPTHSPAEAARLRLQSRRARKCALNFPTVRTF